MRITLRELCVSVMLEYEETAGFQQGGADVSPVSSRAGEQFSGCMSTPHIPSTTQFTCESSFVSQKQPIGCGSGREGTLSSMYNK